MAATGRQAIGYANNASPNRIIHLVGSIFLIGLITFIYLSPYRTLVRITSAVAGMSVAYACLRLMACLTPKPAAKDISEIGDWPFYTVLVPLFQEANMVAPLMSALAKIDYPPDKLEILMICEEIDRPTIRAVKARTGGIFHIVVVPPGSPQTKPRALNYALYRARGDFVTIYDAEDVPHPQQLKEAVSAFKANPAFGAVQAPLDYANDMDNGLTRQFALEYAALFHVWLPFLASARLPFPLGGTSNHMRREALDGVRGWDSHNVTEDADLSFRLAAAGWQIGYIISPTQEEAVSEWKSWHFQRARWLKGFMQTWMVHMGRPFLPRGFRGIARFFTLQLTLGLTLMSAFFHLPALLIFTIIWASKFISGQSFHVPLPFWVSLGVSYSIGILIGIVGAIRAGKPHLIPSALFMPFYWLALFPPALQALWDLRRRPYHWHKTQHGVSPAAKPVLPLESLPPRHEYLE